VLSQVTQKAALQQGSTKAKFLQLRRLFFSSSSYFSKPHIPFGSEIQVDCGGKIRGQWFSLRTIVYQDSQHEDNVAGSEIPWETVKRGRKQWNYSFFSFG